MQYIKIMNFDKEANAIINRAIQFSESESCGEINTVHLFLALVEKTDMGKDILEQMNTTFDSLYESYKDIAKTGDYYNNNGRVDIYNLDNMTQELFIILTAATSRMAMRNRNVTAKSLFEQLLSVESETLDDFLERFDTSVEQILNSRSKKFVIPEQLSNFVVDMNSEDSKNKEQISNVNEYVDTMIEVLSRKLEANPCFHKILQIIKTHLKNLYYENQK